MTGIPIPRSPSPDDVRAAELAMLPRLVAEQRQPPVGPWVGRCSRLIALIIATERTERRVA